MIAPNLEVTLTDGTEYRVESTMSDLMAWERYAVAHGLEVLGSTITMMLFYAWRGARKLGICDEGTGLEAFADRISDFDIDEPEPVDPTRPAHGAG